MHNNSKNYAENEESTMQFCNLLEKRYRFMVIL